MQALPAQWRWNTNGRRFKETAIRRSAAVLRRMHLVGNPGALPAEEQSIAGAERKLGIDDVGACRQQQQPAAIAPGNEFVPARMPPHRSTLGVVQAGAPEMPIG